MTTCVLNFEASSLAQGKRVTIKFFKLLLILIVTVWHVLEAKEIVHQLFKNNSVETQIQTKKKEAIMKNNVTVIYPAMSKNSTTHPASL